MYFESYGSMKPGVGAHLIFDHPFARDAIVVVPFTDNVGAPTILLGGGNKIGALVPPVLVPNASATLSWVSNKEGLASRCATATGGWSFGSSLLATAPSLWVPTTAITIAYIRRKLDGTNRAAPIFTGNNDGSWGGTSSCVLLTPYSDGTCYWDFGGNGGANRITAAGLTFSQVVPERWIATAGPQGSALWQNGIKVASQATAISRVAESTTAQLNNSSVAGAASQDIADFNYFAVYATQWSDELCRWWSAEPYAHLYANTWQGQNFVLGNLAPLATGCLPLTGVG